MKLLLIGLVIFLGSHLLPTYTNARQGLIRRLGLYPYKGLFGLVALLGLSLIVIGKQQAASILLWQPPSWGSTITYIIMLPALVLLAAAYLPGNSKRYTRHPMLWGVTLWSVAHLFANGDLASLLIFISLGLFALFDMWSANRRGAVLSNVSKSIVWDFMVISIGALAYLGVMLLHPVSSPLRIFSP